MKINKLNNQTFYDFASVVLGVNVELYKEVLQITRTENSVKLKLYLGGEIEDVRKFLFQDTKCIFANNAHGESKKDISYNWLMYLLEYVDELSEEDKQAIVDEYNLSLEKDIESYSSKKRQQLISL